MDWKLFLSTFGIIFLAELGDKTQLTAMAQSTAGAHAKWTVFWAASAALMFSTLLAVLFGSKIQQYVPEMYIKLTAGVLFVVFGAILLNEALSGKKEVAAVSGSALAPEGFFASLAFELAAEFEEAAAADYRALAASATSESLRNLFLTLANEEEGHYARMSGMLKQHKDIAISAPPLAPVERLVKGEVLNEEGVSLLRQAAEHEKATTAFYETVSRAMHIPALEQSFAALAAEERDHARRLEEAMEG